MGGVEDATKFWPLTEDELSFVKEQKLSGINRRSDYSPAEISVQIFMDIAEFSAPLQKKSAIQLQGNYFTLTLDGHILDHGKIPTAPGRTKITPRVLITAAAMSVALLPLVEAYDAVMNNFDKYQLGKQGTAADTPLTLLSVVGDETQGLRSIGLKPFFYEESDTVSYDLDAQFDHGENIRFSVIETGVINRAANFNVAPSWQSQQTVLRALCAPLISEIYAESQQHMSELEKTGLYELMHKKLHIGGVSLGEIFDLPQGRMAE